MINVEFIVEAAESILALLCDGQPQPWPQVERLHVFELERTPRLVAARFR
jgi:hypothetical protein